MEFDSNDKVIVNPLRIRSKIVNELEASLILFFTGVSRDSAKIIQDQISSITSDNKSRLSAMHKVKTSAYKIKELLFKGDVLGISEQFKLAWEAKKSTSSSISNDHIEDIERMILSKGALSMKVSGAGGGGFIMIFVKFLSS